MRCCENCHINIIDTVQICPLCYREIDDNIGDNYNSYPKVEIQLKKLSRLKIALIASQVILVLAITLAAILKGHAAWFLVTGGGMLYAGFSIAQSMRKKDSLGFLMLKHISLICILGFAIDYFTGFTMWSTNYMIPFVLTIGAFIISVIIMVKPVLFRDYFVYQITLAVFCALSLLLRIFNLSTVRWTATLAAMYSVITVIGLVVFAGRKTKLELKKRLHI